MALKTTAGMGTQIVPRHEVRVCNKCGGHFCWIEKNDGRVYMGQPYLATNERTGRQTIKTHNGAFHRHTNPIHIPSNYLKG